MPDGTLTRPETTDPHPIDKAIGRAIHHRRIIMGMSQTKLADQCGITFQQVQKYEKGTNRVVPSRLYALAKALDVPVTFFFQEAETPTEFEPERSNMLMRLCERFDRLPQAEQDAVYKLVVALTDRGEGDHE